MDTSFGCSVACSRLQDSGEKLFSKKVEKGNAKNAWGLGRAPPFPSRTRFIFVLLVLTY